MLVGEQKLLFPSFKQTNKLDFSELAWNLRQDTHFGHCFLIVSWGKARGEKCILKEKQELALNNGHIEC